MTSQDRPPDSVDLVGRARSLAIELANARQAADAEAVSRSMFELLPQLFAHTRGMERIAGLQQVWTCFPYSMSAYGHMRAAFMEGWNDASPSPTDDPVLSAIITACQYCQDGRHPEAEQLLRGALLLEPGNPFAAELLANVLFDGPQHETADRIYQRLAEEYAWPAGLNRTSDGFLSALELSAASAPAVLMTGDLLSASPRQVMAVSVDRAYGERYLPELLSSLVAQGLAADSLLHVHLINAGDSEDLVASWRRYGLPLAVSTEAVALAQTEAFDTHVVREQRTYYACARYRLLSDLLDRYDCPIWIMDADLTARSRLDRLSALTEAADIACIPLPDGWRGPHFSCYLSLAGFMPTAVSRRFARLLRAYIDDRLGRGYWGWGLDQAAFAIVLGRLKRIEPALRIRSMSRETVDQAATATAQTLFATHVGSMRRDG